MTKTRRTKDQQLTSQLNFTKRDSDKKKIFRASGQPETGKMTMGCGSSKQADTPADPPARQASTRSTEMRPRGLSKEEFDELSIQDLTDLVKQCHLDELKLITAFHHTQVTSFSHLLEQLLAQSQDGGLVPWRAVDAPRRKGGEAIGTFVCQLILAAVDAEGNYLNSLDAALEVKIRAFEGWIPDMYLKDDHEKTDPQPIPEKYLRGTQLHGSPFLS